MNLLELICLRPTQWSERDVLNNGHRFYKVFVRGGKRERWTGERGRERERERERYEKVLSQLRQ